MEMPVEVLERLSHRCKRVAGPEVNLEQLRRVEQSTRREWWQEIKVCQAEYDTLHYDRDKFLEANIALARLKLVVSFLDKREAPPPDHGFSQQEIDLVREFEQFIVYDRLSLEDIKNYVRGGRDDEQGIFKLAKHAAVNGYGQMYRLMEQRNIPNDLAFAVQRVYQERIRKVEAAAAEIGQTETYQGLERSQRGTVAGRTSAAEARRMEQAYMAAVEARLGGKARGTQWKNIERFNSLKKIHSELKLIKPTSLKVVRETMPHGLGVRAVIERRKFLIFVMPALLLVLRVLSDYKELYVTGADVNLSLAEAMPHIEEAIAQARGTACVLGLAATAGWEQRAIDYARRDALPSPKLSLVLIDLKDRAVHYNPGDERLEGIVDYLGVK